MIVKDNWRCRRPAWLLLPAMFLVLALLSFGLTGCGAEDAITAGPEAVKTLRLALTREPLSLDPAQIRNIQETLLVQALYSGLFSYDLASGEVKPSLAVDWKRSEDGLVYTFNLRAARFYSSRVLTAADVKYSLTRLLNRSVNSPWAFLLRNVAGASAYSRGLAREVSGIVVVDPSTVKITLVQPQPDFLFCLAQPAASVVDQSLLESAGDRFGKPGTRVATQAFAGGSGPFYLSEWAGKRFMNLEVNPYYYGSPALNRVEVTFEPAEDALVEFAASDQDVVLGLGAKELKEAEGDPILKACRRSFPLDGMVALLWPASSKAAPAYNVQAALNRSELAASLANLAEAAGDNPDLPQPPKQTQSLQQPGAATTAGSAAGVPAGQTGTVSGGDAAQPNAGGKRLAQTVEMFYPADGLGLCLSPENISYLAKQLAGQLQPKLGLSIKLTPVGQPMKNLAKTGRNPMVAGVMAPMAGTPWSWGPESLDEPASTPNMLWIPLLRPQLTVLAWERVSGFSIGPHGEMDWSLLQVSERIPASGK